jgi:hypothetical protein
MPGTAENARRVGLLGGRPKGSPTVHVGRAAKRAKLRARILKDAELSADHTIEAIRRGAFYDPRALFDSNGNLRPIKDLSAREAWCIASFDVVQRNLTSGDGQVDQVIKVRFVGREKYLEMAAKHLGLLTDRVDHTGEILIRHEVDVAVELAVTAEPAIAELDVVRPELPVIELPAAELAPVAAVELPVAEPVAAVELEPEMAPAVRAQALAELEDWM